MPGQTIPEIPDFVAGLAVPYAGPMFTGLFSLFGIAAATALLAWVAYKLSGAILAAAVLALGGAGIIGLIWRAASRSKTLVLHDPSISTLVFPPDSKLHR